MSRTITIKAGSVAGLTFTLTSSPGTVNTLNAGATTTRTVSHNNAVANYITLNAESAGRSGDLVTQGSSAVFSQWAYWSTNMPPFNFAFTTVSGSGTELVLGLLAQSDPNFKDGTIQPSYTITANSATTWSPSAGNIVIHLLDNNFEEITNSLAHVASLFTWGQFVEGWFTSLKCTSGGKTRTWTKTAYTSGAYLLNVDTAVFEVVPAAGKGVERWYIVGPTGTVVSYGRGNTVTMSDFVEGCVVHLYLTSGSPNPRIKYEGFDTAGDVPGNQSVLVTGLTYEVGSVWSSPDMNPAQVALTPVAWADKILGQTRSVIIDDVETPLDNADGTTANVVSGIGQYSATNVKFKQTQAAPGGTLTLNIAITADEGIADNLGVTLVAKQRNTVLGSLTESGEVDYYVGDDPIVVEATIDYGEEDSTNFVVGMLPAVVYPADVVGAEETTLDASEDARTLTFSLNQKVLLGILAGVDINLTRDISIGELLDSVENTDPAGVALTVQSRAGSVLVEMAEASGQLTSSPIVVTCVPNPGYVLKTLHVKSADGLSSYYAQPAPVPQTPTSITLNVPYDDTGTDIKVILVMAAELLTIAPVVVPMRPDDSGKFEYQLTNEGHGDFRVGDTVTLDVTPVLITGAPITGLAIGSPVFNDVTLSPTRDGVGVTVSVALRAGSNVFKVPCYVVFAPSTTPVGAGASVTGTTWDITDNLVISGTTYYRIGSIFTVTVPLTSGSPAWTVISAQIKRRVISSGTNYIEVGVLLPVVAGEATRTFTGTLRGETQCIAVYAQGSANPSVAFAAFDYGTNTYITGGQRPTVALTPVSPAVLSDNQVGDIEWPESDTPGEDYETSAFLVVTQTVEELLLPQVSIRVSSVTASSLEVWNPTDSVWVSYLPRVATLAAAFTYFRVCLGTPPSDLVAVEFQTGQTADASSVVGCVVTAASGTLYDSTFTLPRTLQVVSRSVIHIRVVPPFGYVATGWYVNGVLTEGGGSLSVVVPDTGLTLKPQVAVRGVVAKTLMIVGGDRVRYNTGIWVSKLFRGQHPWKPLTAHVIVRPDYLPITLGVVKDDRAAPESIETDDPAMVAITVAGNGMRRLPPGAIQTTRFVRYLVECNQDVEISSIAVGSGAYTMKGGH